MENVMIISALLSIGSYPRNTLISEICLMQEPGILDLNSWRENVLLSFSCRAIFLSLYLLHFE
jgi:hypothetical protein